MPSSTGNSEDYAPDILEVCIGTSNLYTMND